MAIRLSSRSVVGVFGPDAVSFLQGVVTQDVQAASGASFAALLSPQGKIQYEFILVPAEGGFLLDCEAGFADALVARLKLYRLRAKVEIERRTDLCVVVAHDGALAAIAGGAAFEDPRLFALGWRGIGPDGAATATGPDEDYDGRRIALGVPELGKDFAADEMFLLDVNYDVLNGVSYKKGCFVGQETTSRMKRKGEIRKRTLILRFDGAPPPKGEPMIAGDSTLGEVLSGAPGCALALIRLDRLAAATAAPITADGREMKIVFPAYLEKA